MDVICERCKAEYEFDEALLGEKGTTVKCSACGHVFRVLPPHRDLARSHLKLRFAKDGTVKALSSLRELQQRIRAGEVSFDDELGRDGFPFRPLRDVPELKNFFAPIDKGRTDKPPLEQTTVRPDASRLGGSIAGADKTVEGRVPGNAGATVPGRAEDTPPPSAYPTNRPPLPGARPRERDQQEAGAQPALEVSQFSEAPPAREPTGPQVVPHVTTPESRPRAFSKHTMMGVGPEDLQLPPPPRMPVFSAAEGAKPGYAANMPSQPSAERGGSPHGTLQGTPAAAPLGGQRSPHATLHGAPAPQFGLAGGVVGNGLPHPSAAKIPAASASYDRGGTFSPLRGAPAAEPESELVAPHEVPESTGSGGFSSTDALVARLRADAAPPVLDVPDSNRRLYLDDDEKAPSRIEDGSSKFWLSALLLLLLGGGGWLGWLAIEGPVGEYDLANGEPVPLAPSEAEDASSAEQLSAELDRQLADPLAVAPALANDPPRLDAAELARMTAEPARAEPAAAVGAPSGSSAAQGDAEVRSAARAKLPATGAGAAEPPEPVGSTPTPAATPARSPSATPPESARASAAAVAKPEREPAMRATPERAAGPVPEDYGAWVNKGDQLFSRGDHEGAQKAFKAALNLRPTGSEANAGLGFALLSTGKAREALPYFDAAASSGYAEANIGLGDAYRKLGQPSSAIEAYQAYLDRLAKGSRADYARSQIEKLKGGDTKPTHAPSTPASEAPGAASRNDGYRPAGEFTEPAAPSAPASAQPSESPP